MGGAPVKGKIATYFKDHPGVHVYAEELCSDLDETRGRVLSGIAHLIRLDQFPGLIRIGKGGPWVYRPEGMPATAAKPMFEQVAKTKAGDLILQDEVGNLYRAKELE